MFPTFNNLNSLPNDKALDQSNWKAFADDKVNVTEKLKFVLGRVETIVGKVENTGYGHFSVAHNIFQKASFMGVVNSLPNDKFLDMTKLKAFADDKLKFA